jgi:glycosyltransferase involved in cell wall biosynthesis
VALLTGGQDPHYARGLARELLVKGVAVALIAGDELASGHDPDSDGLEVHNLIGRQHPHDGRLAKVWRVLRYYGRFVVFAARSDARLFHILWFRKFPYLERTLLNAYLKLLGKKLLFTAHNVDDQVRDGRPITLAGRLSLRFLYRVVDHIFVHTASMKRELVEEFHVPEPKVTVVPFGINDVIPPSTARRAVAKQQLGIRPDEKVLLFFGQIAPYKGVEDLLRALAQLVATDPRFTLILAGRVKNRRSQGYWREIERLIAELRLSPHIRQETRYIPDDDVGLFFRAADVSVLPYRRVYQSGVLALSYAQGLPVIVADVGSMKDDVIEGETGLVFRPGQVLDLVDKIRAYFASALFEDLEAREHKLRDYGAERFSWKENAERTCAVYERLLRG